MILLPGMGVILIPGCLLWFTRNSRFAAVMARPDQVLFWVALAIGFSGVFLSTWTVTLFVKVGLGTPAPWEPHKRLVICGPYRHVRNPMITSVLLVLLAEALLLRSWPISAWMVVFFAGNAVYFPFVEEKDLERRFGNTYLAYKENVPRWIPRLRPWKGTETQRITSKQDNSSR